MKRVNLIIFGCVVIVMLLLFIILMTSLTSKTSTMSFRSEASEANYEKDVLRRPLLKFALKLFQSWQASDEANLLFSPLSITNGFAMLLLGADKESARQIFNAMYFSEAVGNADRVAPIYSDLIRTIDRENSDAGNGTVLVKNRVFVNADFKLKAKFENNIQNYYFSEIEKVNFAENRQESIDEINKWVEKASSGKISKLFDEPLDANTKLVLLNVIYFAKFWAVPFDKDLTKMKKFKVNSKQETIDTPLMFRRDNYRHSKNPSLQYSLLEIPYTGKNLNCYVLLPKEGEDLRNLMTKITNEDIEKSIDDLKPAYVALSLPKFKLETSLDLQEPLKNLGLTDIFDEKADLSKISDQSDLRVSKVVHKSIIELSEVGTEAAAATGIVVEGRSGRASLKFTVDRPFLFFIRNNETGIIYFAGRVYKP